MMIVGTLRNYLLVCIPTHTHTLERTQRGLAHYAVIYNCRNRCENVHLFNEMVRENYVGVCVCVCTVRVVLVVMVNRVRARCARPCARSTGDGYEDITFA